LDENSSRYVDNIAMDRIVNLKLSCVRHSPYKSYFRIEDKPFENFNEISHSLPKVKKKVINGFEHWLFESAAETPYKENNNADIICHPVQAPIGNIVFVHGLYEDNPLMYQYLISMINKQNLNVFFMTLPYHYSRKPGSSAFSGEYFWSADIPRCQSALKQSVFDLCQTINLVEESTGLPTFVVAFSMGGGIALKLVSIFNELKGIFLINSVSTLTKLTWESPLLRTIKSELLGYDYSFEQVEKSLTPFEPFSDRKKAEFGKKVILGYGLYDQVVKKQDYSYLIERLNPYCVYEYNAGHLNILRVPKLANDIVNTFNGIVFQKQPNDIIL